jgi:hypothetical protein
MRTVTPSFSRQVAISAGAAACLLACSSGSGGSGGEPTSDQTDGGVPVVANLRDGGPIENENETGDDASGDAADSAARSEGGAASDGGPNCRKTLTVVCTVGTDCGAISSHSNGCWTSIDADGAIPGSQWRKCSSNNDVVGNASAPNWALDDTSVAHPAGQDQSFLNQCANGATGFGFEYMAYRGGWEILGHSGLKAYFAELHSSDNDVDDYYRTGAWQNNAQLAAHSDVYPMINIAPIGVSAASAAATIESDGYSLCASVANHGYFAIYAGDWRNGYGNSDARAIAMGTALNLCTQGGSAGPGGSCELGGSDFAKNTCTETLQCDSGLWVPRPDDASSCDTGVEPNGKCVLDDGSIVAENTCTATLQCDNGAWVDRATDPTACATVL